ncbi:hypothetical protein VIGAN_10191700 [Vigna angularis var. angularis]|uniref:Uncharacterized protein n=1 Tax=Vigna angularis var. angularis TaxID=157739 RepID=A0A0S3T548_PHAAN|nr:hypothetical protein VIGAN_10191700 [Vigna angularis var. angularis]
MCGCDRNHTHNSLLADSRGLKSPRLWPNTPVGKNKWLYRESVDSIRGIGNIVVKSRAFSCTWGYDSYPSLFFPLLLSIK